MDSQEMPVYPATDRRKNNSPSAVIFLLTTVHDKIEVLDKKLTDHIADETQTLAKEIANHMHRAFPGGDPEGHRTHHEAVIRKEEKRADFWDTMTKELGKWSLIGFIGWAAVALWKHFLQGPT